MQQKLRRDMRPGTCSTVLAFTLFALAGCAPLTRDRAAPSPPLELISAASFDLPTGCEPVEGQVYRTNYLVHPDGSVTQAASGSGGDGCVEQALRAWVSSFRYGPVAVAMPAVIDWIAVTASRGS